jgi:hypothetical protein
MTCALVKATTAASATMAGFLVSQLLTTRQNLKEVQLTNNKQVILMS